MTKQLYLEDCYLKEFEAMVTKVENNKIVLDQTAFYPESGGQLTDKGKLIRDSEEFHISMVKKSGADIIHKVDKEGLKAGDKVKGIIDWDRRYKFMKYHTASHVLSTVVNKETGAQITGNQIKEDEARVDFNLETFDREKLKEYEQKANEIIAKELPVELKFLPREEAFRIPALVKLKMMLPETIKIIRIVTIQGFDQQACAGTHVKNLKEIGKIEITKAENKGANNRRVYLKLI
ncbi:alanyl-tRNA editing protein [Candidatus Woesearchaeota archaeon]|nr:alanyl-tRNA editing protein [Candidatus Woesearchaeota archaeon]